MGQVPGVLRGCDQINVMGALLFQKQKGIRQTGNVGDNPCLSRGMTGNVMVLAEYTAQGTMAEKNGTSAPGTGKAWFLPFVERSKPDTDFVIRSAEAQLFAGSIDAAVPRA